MPELPEAMAVSFEIFLPTWLLAASLASLFALLVWRTSGAEAKGELAEPPEQKAKDEPPERPQDALGAEQKAKDERDELGAVRDGELDDWQFVPEPPEPQTRAGRELFVTLRAGERVHPQEVPRPQERQGGQGRDEHQGRCRQDALQYLLPQRVMGRASSQCTSLVACSRACLACSRASHKQRTIFILENKK